MTNFLDDDSRWTVLSARMETPDFVRRTMADLMADFVASLPEGSPALALWRSLPRPPKPGAEAPSGPYTIDSVFTFRPGFWFAL